MSGVSISPTAMTLPLWLVVSVLALLALTAILAAFRASRVEALIVASIVILLGVAISLWTEQQATSRRQAIEDRFIALQARAQSPGSALACVEDNAGKTVDTGCERIIFASPEAAAAATSFTAARFALLADASRYTGHRGARFDVLMAGLRGSLERDRFGLLANFLAVRENCTADQCDWLAVLQNPATVQQNLKKRTFESYLARHASAWTQERVADDAANAPPVTESAQQLSTAKGTPLPQNYVLPSADSIPPISIMTNEPAAATSPTPTPTARPHPNPTPTTSEAQPAKPLRPAKRPPRPAATTNTSNAPLALTPPSAAE